MKVTKTIIRSAMLSTISIASLGLGTVAYAQDEAPAAEDAVEEEPIADDEIIVTATRRDQAAQDIPLAVSVVAGEQLANAGVVDIRGIQQLAPSPQVPF
jgi:iron complex outermembrane receptor protein